MNLYSTYISLLIESLSSERKKYINRIKSGLTDVDIRSIERMLKKLKIMPVGKQKHSIRVSKNLMDVGVVDKHVVLGALFHDYIERGGDVDDLDISENARDIIRFLSAFDNDLGESDNAPLEHLISVFGGIENQDLKNNLVMIKLSDRIDNLNRRGKNVSKSYLKKSIELIRFLMINYVGSIDLGELLLVLNRKLTKKIKKSIEM